MTIFSEVATVWRIFGAGAAVIAFTVAEIIVGTYSIDVMGEGADRAGAERGEGDKKRGEKGGAL